MYGLQKRKIKMLKGTFFKSTMTLISGSVITQVLAICISPIMTRLYTENQIGEYTLILTAVTMFGSVICGRYDMSIVSAPSEKKMYALIKLSFSLTVILSAIVSIGYALYYSYLNEISMSFFQTSIWLFILLNFTGIGYILISYNNRNQDYKLMTSVNVIREFGKDIILVILGYFQVGTIGLLISQCAGVCLGLNRQAKKLKGKIKDIQKCTIYDMMDVAIEYKNQLIFSVPASFANSFSYSVLNIFVSNMYGLDMLGYYSMSFRMLGAPLSLVSANISKVFFERAAHEYNKKKNFRNIFIQTTGLLMFAAIPITLILMFFSPFLFELFFGVGWARAGEFVRYLAPMFGIRLVVSALSPAIIVCNKQKIELLLQALFFIASLGVYSICRGRYGIDIFLSLISLLYSIIYIIYYFVMLKFSKDKEL